MTTRRQSHLHQPHHPHTCICQPCQYPFQPQTNQTSQLLPQLASKYPDIKLLSIPAPLAIPNYPERNTPTLLFYHDTNVAHQTVTLAGLNGVKTNLRNLELLLVEVGCVKEGDMRLKAGAAEDGGEDAGEKRRGIRTGGRGRGVGQDDEDDDPWD